MELSAKLRLSYSQRRHMLLCDVLSVDENVAQNAGYPQRFG